MYCLLPDCLRSGTPTGHGPQAMKAALLAFLIWLGLFTPPTPLRIDGYDPGGDVSTYLTWFDRFAKTGTPVVLDGACISACTLFLAVFEPDKICVTPRASL